MQLPLQISHIFRSYFPDMAHRNLPIVDWLEIEASAPGKLIISGEYSVVYERQAIASAIDLRTKVIIRPNKDGKVRLNLKNLNNIREWPVTSLSMCRLVSKYSDCLNYNDTMPVKLNHLLHARYYEPPIIGVPEKVADDATMAFLLLYIGLGDSYATSARPSLDIEVESTVPVGSGLGSSSAFSVALCGALMRVFRVVAEKYIISNWAFNIDKFFHGRPSGVDNSIITMGGYILFQNGKIKANCVEHSNQIKVMLIDTKVSRSTRALSETVANQLRDDQARVNGIFNEINLCTIKIWEKINSPSFSPEHISLWLLQNQNLLDSLGVGHERLSDIRTRAQNFNLIAKQTGAGGGGTAFILYTDTKQVDQLRQDLMGAGYDVHDHTVGCKGLVVNIKTDPARKFVLGGEGSSR